VLIFFIVIYYLLSFVSSDEQNINNSLQSSDFPIDKSILSQEESINDLDKLMEEISNSMSNSTRSGLINLTPVIVQPQIVIPENIPDYGLIFKEDTVVSFENELYSEKLIIIGLDANLQAVQFRLHVNGTDNDDVFLSFQGIQKGAHIMDANWILSYNVFRGPLNSNGASVDEIFVLLFNANQNSGLPPGDYYELLRINYGVVNLPNSPDRHKSSIKITHTEASTYQGFPIDIRPSREDLVVIGRNREAFYGDVNLDGCVDVLDIVLVVDHISGRDSLEDYQFERANIAPWLQGQPVPSPDEFVNIQDLAVLQQIILTGEYPDGTPTNTCNYNSLSKQGNIENENIKFFVNESGITVQLNSGTEIRAAQIEFKNVISETGVVSINTELGQGYSYLNDESLNVLLFDRFGEKVISSGEQLIADIVFEVTNPENVIVDKVILIDESKERITENNIEVVYAYPPTFLTDFSLFQNYPNPFNPQTTVQYSVPDKSNVILKVFDLLGNEIATLVNEEKLRGTHIVNFDGTGIASGIYFYQMVATDLSNESGKAFVETKKMVLIK
jgi:hypothetical protein